MRDRGSMLVLVMFGVSMLLRRQWEERERLTFALAEQPLTMIRGSETDRALPAFDVVLAEHVG